MKIGKNYIKAAGNHFFVLFGVLKVINLYFEANFFKIVKYDTLVYFTQVVCNVQWTLHLGSSFWMLVV